MKHTYSFTIVFILFIFIHNAGISQCTNTFKHPTWDIIAPEYNVPMVVRSDQYAGDYYTIKNLMIGETYEFTSDSINDYLTIRDADGLALVTHGGTPLTYTVTGDDILTVHINLTTPPCGTQLVFRTTRVTCTSCPPIPPGVGVGTADPEAVLDVGGEIKVSNSVSPPAAGMIRWNTATADFEGYTGNRWVSLTQDDSKWGLQPSNSLVEKQKSSAGVDGDPNDKFGGSVSISGDYAIVGAFDSDGNNGHNSAGSAYIFHRSGASWTKQVVLSAGGSAPNDYFGASVSISGDYAIIGVVGDDDDGTDSGSAYIYHRSGISWTQQAKLTAGTDGAPNDYFGGSVSISGDYAIIGASGDDDDGTDSGSAYIFYRSGTSWSKQAKIKAVNDGAPNDYFGTSVSISGDYAIIGAWGDDDDGTDSGSAYIFYRSGTNWSKQAKITAGSEAAAGDNFGKSVSISGDYTIIAAHDDEYGFFSGSAYIFIRSGTSWTKQVKLTAGIDGAAGDLFGSDVSISGDYAIIGAYQDDDDGTDSGSAYIFLRTGTIWTKQAKLLASDGAAGDNFGRSVSISGDYAIVGAEGDDDDGTDSGSVYFFNQ